MAKKRPETKTEQTLVPKSLLCISKPVIRIRIMFRDEQTDSSYCLLNSAIIC